MRRGGHRPRGRPFCDGRGFGRNTKTAAIGSNRLQCEGHGPERDGARCPSLERPTYGVASSASKIAQRLTASRRRGVTAARREQSLIDRKLRWIQSYIIPPQPDQFRDSQSRKNGNVDHCGVWLRDMLEKLRKLLGGEPGPLAPASAWALVSIRGAIMVPTSCTVYGARLLCFTVR